MKIKITMKYHFTCIRMVSSISQRTSAGKDVEKVEPFSAVGENADWCNHCGKYYGEFSKN